MKSELRMYYDAKIAASFAELEQNEKNFRVADIIDRLVLYAVEGVKDPLRAADLGGGAHPDRYHRLFNRLLKDPKGRMDWVDVSPIMLKLAEKYASTDEYLARKEVIRFVESDILEYLEQLPDETLHVAIMKYVINHIRQLDRLFALLARKLKGKGSLVSTMDFSSPEMKSVSTNARFLYNGQEFPENETRTLKDGDTYTVKFFKESGNPDSGYLEGTEITRYYHAPDTMKNLAQKHHFDVFIGDWKAFLPKEKQEGETLDQDVIVLRKKR